MRTLASYYNQVYEPFLPIKAPGIFHHTKFNCTIKGFISQSYGKYGDDDVDTQVIMEYNQMFPFMTPYLPQTMIRNQNFVDWLSTPNIMEKFAETLMFVLPGDRISYYKTNDIAAMRKSVYDVVNEITETLGFYPLAS